MYLQELKKTATAPQMAALNYIETFAKDAGIPIDLWDIPKVFGSELTLKATEINRKFARHLRVLQIREKAELPENVVQSIIAAQSGLVSRNKSYYEETLDDQTSRLNSRLSDVRNHISKIKEIRQLLENVPMKKLDLVSQVKEILLGGYWEYIETLEDQDFIVSFITKPVRLSRAPDLEGRTYALDFGRLKFGITTQGMVRAWRVENQIEAAVLFSESNFYPNIRHNGDICWGTGEELVAKCEIDQNFVDIFLILERLMLTDSEDNGPYVSLVQFFTEGRTRDGKQPWIDALTPEMRAIYGVELDGELEQRLENGVIVHRMRRGRIPSHQTNFWCESGRRGECEYVNITRLFFSGARVFVGDEIECPQCHYRTTVLA